MGLAPGRPTAVLLMAYGSPESLDQMEAYLLDVRGGRPTPPGLVEEIQHRYAQIGGRSPLLDLTRQQAAALQAELNRRMAGQPAGFAVYVGMRHWEPRIAGAVEQMVTDGYQQVIALVMAPHASRMSTGMYFTRLDEAIAQQQVSLEVARVESWHDHPGLIEALSIHAASALAKFGELSPYIIFSAHSLPERILQHGDPYDSQLRETATLVASRLNWPAGRWEFCYQSAGQSAEAWLGPQVEQVVTRLVDSGEANLLVVPVGFVCDHVEVLYDIDIVARQLAAKKGARLERSPSLNSSPKFITALADLVLSQMSMPTLQAAPGEHLRQTK